VGASSFHNKSKQQKTLMDNPAIYSDGLANSIQDSPLRTQQKMLGALKNMGGDQTTPTTQSLTSVTTATGLVLSSNTARKFLTLQNTSTQEVYIKLNSNPTVPSAGTADYTYVLKPASVGDGGDGGVLTLQSFTGSVHARTNVSTSTLAIAEFV